MEYRLYSGQCCMTSKGCCKKQCDKLSTYDYLCDIPKSQQNTDYVEVQFRNARKGYYVNSEKLELTKGDLVAVESSQGHDIGTISLTGQLVLLQMKKRFRFNSEIKRIYRKAKPSDIKKFEEAKAKEYPTMIRSRKIAKRLELQMKISYVEYQGDGTKAIFYYIADERVDFRQLIKDLAADFHIRIEMKQIGVRQEAGQIGGIGSCGRELCCAKWMFNFVSVSTGTAQLQEMSVNTQKLAGQCTKLRCCLNYEIDNYIEAQRHFPSREIPLETQSDIYYCIKTDILKNQMHYSTNSNDTTNIITISPERAFEIIHMNKNGNKPPSLETEPNKQQSSKVIYQDILGENITRFDSTQKKSNKLHKQNHPNDRKNKHSGEKKDNSKNE